MRSPFKLLDAYGPEDWPVFFGREREVEQLFEMVTENNLLLIYGPSGAGKTSLVNCGLAGRCHFTDWYPINIRRRGIPIREALDEQLARSLPDTATGSYADIVGDIYGTYLRPVYLIFDQLEELFILGDQKEQEEFADIAAELVNANLPCRILFILREDYLGHLSAFENKIPSLFNRRLRVEPMRQAQIERVITQSCRYFNISLEEPDKNVAQIIQNVGVGRSGIQLPYLQVYLDRLWQESFQRSRREQGQAVMQPAGGEQMGDPSSAEQEQYAALTFTSQDIERVGRIENVLHQFLLEQERLINRELRQKFPQAPRHSLRQLLDIFVTPEATKRPICYHRAPDTGWIVLEEPPGEELPLLPPRLVTHCLEALQQSRLIHISDRVIELAHDSLAALIDAQRSEEQRQINEAKSRLTAAYSEWQRIGPPAYLNEKQLDSLEASLALMQLPPHLAEFVQKSRNALAAKQKEERIRRRQLTAMVVALIAIMSVAAAVSNYYRIETRKSLARQENMESVVAAANALQAGNPSLAFRRAAQAVGDTTTFTRVMVGNILREIAGSNIQCDLVHKATITAVATGEDFVATGDNSGMIHIWQSDCTLFREMDVLHAAPVSALAFSPDQNRLLSGSEAGDVFITDIESGRTDTLSLDGAIRFAAFSNSAEHFLIGSATGQISIYQKDLQLVLSHNLSTPLLNAEFSSDGRYVLAAGNEEIYLRSLVNMPSPIDTSITSFRPYRVVHLLHESFPESPRIFTVCDDRVRILDRRGKLYGDYALYIDINTNFKAQNEIRLVASGRHQSSQLTPSPFLVLGDSTIIKWSYKSPDSQSDYLRSYIDYITSGEMLPLYFTISRNKQYLLTGLSDNRLLIRNFVDGRIIKEIKCRSRWGGFLGNSSHFVSIDGGTTAHIYAIRDTITAGRLSPQAIIDRYNARLSTTEN